ncbi:putrescine transport system permease protein [Roseinatronobacter monicus]|uniref:Putrescine transport system permease protein n=2 Tax=Roseinatronobacter monicus TaxID=393481 RepID=A0A543KEG1_9RHOB|nr:putrescine transport system permease protein [Roseinatronobacter monicus]
MSAGNALTRSAPWRGTAWVMGKLGLSGRTLVIAIPMLWLGVFFLAPFFVLGRISLAEALIARPPYTPLFERGPDGSLQIIASLENYRFLMTDALYRNAYLSSIRVAFVSTIFALLIGYPIAYYIARAPEPKRSILLLMVILPFWTSFLLRVYAWMGFLRSNGVINNTLMSLGLIDSPIQMMQTDFAVYIGIVYTYLPFMILPLYANLTKLDGALLEAASDLGASPTVTFFTVTLPLSLPGIVAGSMLVFIPAIGEYVIPALLGGPNTLMIGRVLWDEFFSSRDWPVASAVAIVMLVLVVAPIMWLQSVQNRREER